MTFHPDDVKANLKWKQADIVLWILTEFAPLSFTVADVIEHMKALGYPAKKRNRKTLQAVLSRLCAARKIHSVRRGEFYVVIN